MTKIKYLCPFMGEVELTEVGERTENGKTFTIYVDNRDNYYAKIDSIYAPADYTPKIQNIERVIINSVAKLTASTIETDIEEVCEKCCDDYTVDINNEYIGKIFQWLIDNDYTICKKK